MKTRLAITAMLVSGLLAGGGGAALAITGLSGSDDASVAQYGQGVNPAEGGNNPSGSGVSPATGNNNPSGQGVLAARQGTSGSGLAFTGYLAIPVMLGGIFLLGMGLLMRRRAAADLE